MSGHHPWPPEFKGAAPGEPIGGTNPCPTCGESRIDWIRKNMKAELDRNKRLSDENSKLKAELEQIRNSF